MIDVAELRARIEQHLSDFAHQMTEDAASRVREFANWIEGKQTEEAEAQSRIEWLSAHGYTVTKN
jgi:DNA-binding response OmpR family regulator